MHDDHDDDMSPSEPHAHGQEGQGSWFITFCAAAALVSAGVKNPYLLPIPDEAIDAVKMVFASAAEQPKKKLDCVMVALSHSPPLGCELKR